MFSKTKIRPFMKNLYDDMPNGYQETINKGMSAVRYFSRNMSYGKGSKEEQIKRLLHEIKEADAIVIGAGAGLSTSAGLTYSGKRFEKYFYDFAQKIWNKRYVFRWFLSVSERRNTLGLGGETYLF